MPSKSLECVHTLMTMKAFLKRFRRFNLTARDPLNPLIDPRFVPKPPELLATEAATGCLRGEVVSRLRRGEGHSSGMIKGREKGAVYPNAQFSIANPDQEVQYSIRRRGGVLVQNGGGHARTETEVLGNVFH